MSSNIANRRLLTKKASLKIKLHSDFNRPTINNRERANSRRRVAVISRRTLSLQLKQAECTFNDHSLLSSPLRLFVVVYVAWWPRVRKYLSENCKWQKQSNCFYFRSHLRPADSNARTHAIRLVDRLMTFHRGAKRKNVYFFRVKLFARWKRKSKRRSLLRKASASGVLWSVQSKIRQMMSNSLREFPHIFFAIV